MDLRSKDKLALITGSTAGIGLAIAKILLSEGARTIVNGRYGDSVKHAISELEPIATGKLFGFTGDLSVVEIANELHDRYPDEKEIFAFLDRGVDGIMTDRPRRLRQIMDEWIRSRSE